MATGTLEERVERLEGDIAELKRNDVSSSRNNPPWWVQIRGDFRNDPDYVEAMRLGREYRESLLACGDDDHTG